MKKTKEKRSKLIIISLLFVFLLGACTKKTVPDIYGIEKAENYYLISAYFQGRVLPRATVIAITKDSSVLIEKTNNKGRAIVKTKQILRKVCCVSLDRCGIVRIDSNREIRVNMKTIVKTKEENFRPSDIRIIGRIYSASGDTSAIFRYQGKFSEYCSDYFFLPDLALSISPNDWPDKNINYWLPEYKGKELNIPKRYRIFYKSAYGKSIINSIYLFSTPE